MEDLLSTLPGILRSIDSPEVVEAAAIAAWKHSAGEGLRDHAVPMRLEQRILFVAVRDAIWQKQLSTMCASLVFRVNKYLGQSLVDRIELQVEPSFIKSRSVQEKQATPLLENEIPVELWAAASAISDKQLRQSFLKAAVSATNRLEKQSKEP